jgi:hypothetical protein
MVSYEDYVGMSAAAGVMGEAAMIAHYRLAPAHWSQIAGYWGSVISSNPQYAQYVTHVQQESARLTAGGAPRPVALGPPPPPAPPLMPPQQQPWGGPQPQPYPNQNQAADFGAEVGKAFNAFGSALGSFVEGAVAGVSVGARVYVRWTDGQRYPGTVTSVAGGQVQVAFPNGQHHWVPSSVVSLT